MRRLVLGMDIAPGLVGPYKCLVDAAQVAACFQVGVFELIDERRGRIIGDKMARELGCEKPCRRGVDGKISKHGLPLRDIRLRVLPACV